MGEIDCAGPVSSRSQAQRKLILETMLVPPPESRVFGPPTPEFVFWDNAIAQQRYLDLVPGVSDHEKAYVKWHQGHPAAATWAELTLRERAEWVQFYFNFNTNGLKVEDVSGEETVVKDRKEHSMYVASAMYKKQVIPEEKKEVMRQKVYDVNGTFIGYLNTDVSGDEKTKLSKGQVIKKRGSGTVVKQKIYGPENGVKKRGPWRPTKHHGPPVDDSLIDPALRSMVTPYPVTRPGHPYAEITAKLKHELREQDPSQWTPVNRPQPGPEPTLATKSRALELPRAQLEQPYIHLSRTSAPKPLSLPRVTLEMFDNQRPLHGNTTNQHYATTLQRPQPPPQFRQQPPQLPRHSSQAPRYITPEINDLPKEHDTSEVQRGLEARLQQPLHRPQLTRPLRQQLPHLPRHSSQAPRYITLTVNDLPKEHDTNKVRRGVEANLQQSLHRPRPQITPQHRQQAPRYIVLEVNDLPKKLDANKVRRGVEDYLDLTAAPADGYQSPYAGHRYQGVGGSGDGSKGEDGEAVRAGYKSPYGL
ncbi:hypothetical protein V8E51_018035 [Hyaloscypha variabilis]